MRHAIVICLLSLLQPVTSLAQGEETQIRLVIDRMFMGMQLGDSAMVGAVFHPATTMATTFRSREGAPVLRESSVQDFLKAVGTPHADPWNEEIWGLVIRTDGDFAQAWCDFAFYVGKNFSHCGVNAFHLHKGKEGWKIFHLADTRRSTDCNIPKEITDKYR
jgi:hypothetical protein